MNLMVPDWAERLKKRAGKTSLHELVSSLLPNAANLYPVVRSCGFDSFDAVVESGTDWNFSLLLNHPEFRKSVAGQREYYRGLLRDYLKQSDIEIHAAATVIALGPDTCFQETLRSVRNRADSGKKLNGLYLFLADDRQEHAFQALGIQDHSLRRVTETAIELLHAVTEPSNPRPIDLKRDVEGKVVAVFSEFHGHSDPNQDMAALQAGILAFARAYGTIANFARHPLTEDDTASFITRFEQFVRNPATREARIVMGCFNKENVPDTRQIASTTWPGPISAYNSLLSLFRKTLAS